MERRLVKLQRLLQGIEGIELHGSDELTLEQLTADSREVGPGALFIAKKGLTQDGRSFIPQALEKGAVAVATDSYQSAFAHITQIIHPDIISLEAQLAANFYEHPTDFLFFIGITGTNGKTTASYLIQGLLEALGEKSALMGTIQHHVGSYQVPSSLTTPSLLENYALFAQAKEQGCKTCVMEVTSHAIDQGRVAGVEFDVGVFTNLSPEHLDYHSTMAAYAQAKSRFFTGLQRGRKSYRKVAVINGDSPYASMMIAECPARILSYGLSEKNDLFASELKLSSQGIEMCVCFAREKAELKSPLIGRYNAYNLLAALSVGIAKGYSLKDSVAALNSLKQAVPGRLESIANSRGIHVFIDFAHTEDALDNVLTALMEVKKGKLITVFGCGGDRDRLKRPKMGAVAEKLSDIAVVTSDNPRHEDPQEITQQILAGFENPQKALTLVDRKEAIDKALSLAEPNDIVLIAGRGHETHQVQPQGRVPFDDRQVARSILND